MSYMTSRDTYSLGRKRRRRRCYRQVLDLPPQQGDDTVDHGATLGVASPSPSQQRSGAASSSVHPCPHGFGIPVVEIEGNQEIALVTEGELVPDVVDEEAEEEDDSPEADPNSVKTPRDIFNVMSTGLTLAAVFAVVGTKRFAVWQYNYMRRRVNFHTQVTMRGAFPSYSKIQRVIFPLLREHLFVPSERVTVEVDTTKSGAPSLVTRQDGSTAVPKAELRYVTLSTWGKTDMSQVFFTSASSIDHAGSEIVEASADLFDSIEDAVVCRHRYVSLSSAVLTTTEVEGDLEIPTVQVCFGCLVDVWLRPRQPVPELQRFVNSVAGDGGLLVLKSVRCSSSYMGSGGTDLFEPSDNVVELDCSDFNAMNSSSAEDVRMYIVYKLRSSQGVPRIHLVFLEGNGSSPRVRRIRCLHLTEATAPSCTSTSMNAPVSGILEDGREYVIYRVILFADNFDPFVGRKGSAGGCYLLPVGIPIRERLGVKGIRVLSMTPPGVSTAKILTTLIPDLVEGTVNGFQITNIRGDSVQLFLDVIGYECDYFAVSEDSDLRGHKSLGPCNLCTFPRGSHGGRHNSMYAYTTGIHSENAAFRRDSARMEAFRTEVQSLPTATRKEAELQSVGLRNMSDERRYNLPLHALHRALQDARPNVPRTIEGQPVVPAAFDPYLSIVTAPDHLFANLIKNVLNANIQALEKKGGKRACMHVLLQHTLRFHGIRSETQYVDEEKGKLQSMSMSSLFEVILVAPWAIAIARSMDSSGSLDASKYNNETVVTLASMLQQLMADTCIYGRAHRDGWAFAKQFTADGWRGRVRNLTAQAMNYIATLDKCSGESEAHAEELDKPNVHRLLELYVHTIPTYGHVRQYQELSLERTHQPLKRALNNSNMKNAQLQVMDHLLADDWKGRVKAGTNRCLTPGSLTEECLAKLGPTVTGSTCSEQSDNVSTEQLRGMFDAALLKEIHDFASVQCDPVHKRDGQDVITWIGSGEYAVQSPNSPFEELNSRGSASLQAYVKASSPGREVHVRPLSRACALREGQSRKGLTNREEHGTNIRCGDVVQAVVMIPESGTPEAGDVNVVSILTAGFPGLGTSPSSTTFNVDTSPTFWYITGLLEAKPPVTFGTFRCFVFAVVVKMTQLEGVSVSTDRIGVFSPSSIYHLHDVEGTSGHLLPLFPGVMKVLCLHFCRGDCTFDAESRTLQHAMKEDRSDRWLLYGSLRGFPPRSG